jgi:hypothetical protein
MRASRQLCIVGGMLVLLAAGGAGQEDKLPVDAAAEEALKQLAGPDFRIRRTGHFLIAYDTEPEVLRDFIARLEATHSSTVRFLERHGLRREGPSQRLEILFFAEREAFLRFAKGLKADATGAAGFYHPGSNRAAFYDARCAPNIRELITQIEALETRLREMRARNDAERQNLVRNLNFMRGQRDNLVEAIHQLVVQHEVAHQVFYNAGLHVRGADNPPWLVEGLACLFETPPGRLGAGLGAVNNYRLVNFREALAGSAPPAAARAEHFQHACAEGRLVPLRRLVGDAGLFDARGPGAENMYAEAWAFVYFLHRRYPAEFGKYLAAVAARKPGEVVKVDDDIAQFEALVAPLDADLTAKWLAFILDQPVRYPR